MQPRKRKDGIRGEKESKDALVTFREEEEEEEEEELKGWSRWKSLRARYQVSGSKLNNFGVLE